MIKLLSLLLLFFAFNFSNAQVNAVTETGKRVTLYNDGTWKYSADSLTKNNGADSIRLNSQSFTKTANQTFRIKSNITNAAIMINTDEWTVKPHRDNETYPEYRFGSKSGNSYVMLVTERTPINLTDMPAIALLNAQKAAVDAAITKQEYRMVNHKKVLYMELSGTIKSIKFKYMAYYYSNETGTTQLIGYTSVALLKQASGEISTFLNGFLADGD